MNKPLTAAQVAMVDPAAVLSGEELTRFNKAIDDERSDDIAEICKLMQQPRLPFAPNRIGSLIAEDILDSIRNVARNG